MTRQNIHSQLRIAQMSRKLGLRQRHPKAPLLVTVAALFGLACSSYGQTGTGLGANASRDAPAPLLGYEVATIKPAMVSGGSFVGRSPDGLSVKNMPIQWLLREAFGLEDDRILDAPPWVKTDRFDIEAKVAESDAATFKTMTADERKILLRPLLEDRLNLKFHYETKVLPVYLLTVSKGGSKLKKITSPADPKQNGLRYRGEGHLNAYGASMEVVVHFLSQQVGRTILDETGLTSKYDFALDWEPDDAPSATMGSNGNVLPLDSRGASLFAAVREQLGLILEMRKAPISVVVIDAIERPSPN
jgi:bla regulator protein blaR1